MAVFTNRATLSYNNRTVSSNTVTGEVVGAVTLLKTAVRGVYSVGDIVTYTVSIANTTATPITDLTISDDLGAYPFGAGTLVPITGFANSVASPAIDSHSEGLVLGVGAKIFTVAGPVLLYGTLSGAIYGVLYWLVTAFVK